MIKDLRTFGPGVFFRLKEVERQQTKKTEIQYIYKFK